MSNKEIEDVQQFQKELLKALEKDDNIRALEILTLLVSLVTEHSLNPKHTTIAYQVGKLRKSKNKDIAEISKSAVSEWKNLLTAAKASIASPKKRKVKAEEKNGLSSGSSRSEDKVGKVGSAVGRLKFLEPNLRCRTDFVNIRKDLDDNGFCVVENILDQSDMNKFEDLFWEALTRRLPALQRHDKSTWTEANCSWRGTYGAGQYKFYGMAQEKHCWLIRKNPAIREIFQRGVYDDEDCCVSLDGSAGLFFPTESKLPLHVDLVPGLPGFEFGSVQAGYNLYGVQTYRGRASAGFVCVPGSHKTYMERWEASSRRPGFSPGKKHWLVLEDDSPLQGERVLVLSPPNSLVMWRSELVHRCLCVWCVFSVSPPLALFPCEFLCRQLCSSRDVSTALRSNHGGDFTSEELSELSLSGALGVGVGRRGGDGGEEDVCGGGGGGSRKEVRKVGGGGGVSESANLDGVGAETSSASCEKVGVLKDVGAGAGGGGERVSLEPLPLPSPRMCRLTQFVTFQPKRFRTQAVLKKKIQCVKDGVSGNHWAALGSRVAIKPFPPWGAHRVASVLPFRDCEDLPGDILELL